MGDVDAMVVDERGPIVGGVEVPSRHTCLTSTQTSVVCQHVHSTERVGAEAGLAGLGCLADL